MTYRFLRWIAGIMLHWFYGDIRVTGRQHIPLDGPLLVAVNHPNALVDSLVAGWVLPRHLRATAKATLFANRAVAFVFRILGVVPLRRSSDSSGIGRDDALRNKNAFGEITNTLESGGAVLIFPEGRSNSDQLMPLKTGLARIALQARRSGVRGVKILPVCLSFEDKASPGSQVAVRIEEPIEVDLWQGEAARELTAEIARRLSVPSSALEFAAPTGVAPARYGSLKRAAAWWGKVTHEIPVRAARTLAVSRSHSADEPAMLTMLFGLGLVLASDAIHVVLVAYLTGSVLLAAFYFVTLVTGAHWAAFGRHR